MKNSLSSIILSIGRQLKSTFQLLLYINKLPTLFKKNDSPHKNEQTILPLTPEPPTLSVSNIPATEDILIPVPKKKRGRPSKKRQAEELSHPPLDPQDTEQIPQDLDVESSVVTSRTSETLISSGSRGKKKIVIGLLSLCVFVGGGYASYLLYTSPSSSQTLKNDDASFISTSQKSLPPKSLQPQLNLLETNNFIKTINPHFLIDKPVTDSPLRRFCIILYNMDGNTGISEEMDIAYLNIPEKVTIAINPYTDDLSSLITDVKSLGHETLLQMPWEHTDKYIDQGSLTVLSQQRQDQLIDNLKTLLALSQGTSGFFVPQGSSLLQHPQNLTLTLQFIANNKNTLIAPPDILMNNLHMIATKMNLNYACITLIDPKLTDLNAIIKLAQRTGFVILAFPLKKNVDIIINDWIKRLEDAKLSISTISDILPLSESTQ